MKLSDLTDGQVISGRSAIGIICESSNKETVCYHEDDGKRHKTLRAALLSAIKQGLISESDAKPYWEIG